MVDVINPDWIDVPQHKPTFVKIKNSKIHGKGAFALKNIKKGTFLGHYMGIIYPKYVTGDYVFHSYRETQETQKDELFSICASDLKKSNWTRYMNCCSPDKKNENVESSRLTNKELYQLGTQKPKSIEGYIVFYAKRDIKKGEELLYYYGDDYSKLLNCQPTAGERQG